MFFDKKLQDVKQLVGRIINSDDQECRRSDNRTIRILVGVVVPIADRKPQMDQAFNVTTKDFSNAGVALIASRPESPDEAVLGFHLSGRMVFFRAELRHSEAIGGGFHQYGYKLFEVLSLKDYPELESLKL